MDRNNSGVQLRPLVLACLLALISSTTVLHAQFGPMVMAAQAPQAHSQEELDAFLDLSTTTDPTLQILRVHTFATRFPKSELLGIAYQHQMHAYQKAGNFDGMLAAGEKALEANQDNLSTLLTLAPVLAHEAARRPDKARLLAQAADYAKRALEGINKTQIPRKITLERWEREAQQMQAEAHGVLGAVALERGQFPDAIREFQTAVTLSPDGGPDYLGLGTAYAASGSKADAEKALRRAADLGPEPVRKHALEELQKLGSAK